MATSRSLGQRVWRDRIGGLERLCDLYLPSVMAEYRVRRRTRDAHRP